jgi:hypothetical protein
MLLGLLYLKFWTIKLYLTIKYKKSTHLLANSVVAVNSKNTCTRTGTWRSQEGHEAHKIDQHEQEVVLDAL